jgi:DNA ligase-1
MKFSEVAQVFDEIEQTSSRLAITRLLAELLKKATPQEAEMISYLSLGNLNPAYIGTQFNFAEKGIYQVLAKLLGKSASTIQTQAKKWGDVGLVLEKGDGGRVGKEHLTVTQVNKQLHEFLKISGTGSQAAKEKKLYDILRSLDVASGKYVLRIIVGKLRLGFSDMTLLDAFSWMQVGDKSLRKILEEAYNVSADIGHLIKVLKQDGVKAIEHMKVDPGVPIRPAAAERMAHAKAIVKKLGTCLAQPKLDGFRLQVHKWVENRKRHVRFFSRNLQDMSEMFPELYKAVLHMPHSFVVEGEAIAYDPETGTFLPFQETAKRRRKYDIEKKAQELPLKLFFFDLLSYEGKSFLDLPHSQRRKKLEALLPKRKAKELHVLEVIEEVTIKEPEQLEDYFNEMVSLGLEGLVVKKPDAVYQAGKRNFNWVKLKRQETGHLDDTIDCVILGYDAGHGKRASFGIGALLVGVYNKKDDRFETVAKVGSGLTDAGWKKTKKKCDQKAVKNKPKNVVCVKELVPDVWVSPDIVCLIRADEISLSPLHKAGATDDQPGFALRFPRLIDFRDDKSARDATTIKELRHLYDLQFEEKKRKRKRR